MVSQYYEAEVVSEYVIRGNTAVLKCNIPSFVADFVKVEAWVGSDSSEYLHTNDSGISHFLQFNPIPIPSILFVPFLCFHKLLIYIRFIKLINVGL